MGRSEGLVHIQKKNQHHKKNKYEERFTCELSLCWRSLLIGNGLTLFLIPFPSSLCFRSLSFSLASFSRFSFARFASLSRSLTPSSSESLSWGGGRRSWRASGSHVGPGWASAGLGWARRLSTQLSSSSSTSILHSCVSSSCSFSLDALLLLLGPPKANLTMASGLLLICRLYMSWSWM